jgi:hypothetical protein
VHYHVTGYYRAIRSLKILFNFAALATCDLSKPGEAEL